MRDALDAHTTLWRPLKGSEVGNTCAVSQVRFDATKYVPGWRLLGRRRVSPIWPASPTPDRRLAKGSHVKPRPSPAYYV
jgi:hypothetical protein